MEVKLNREAEPIQSNNVMIEIGETRYRISKTNQGRLQINKTNFNNGEIVVYPNVSNQIEIE